MPGTLYIVATPIGNLEDITLRALRILKEADLIAAEDTRHTRKLLSHFEIGTPLTACHQHTDADKIASLVHRLVNEEQSIALVTDAGTPGVSDPGIELVKAALAAGVGIVPIPGASAALCALVGSGLPPARFAFEGFPHRAKAARRAELAALAAEPRTLIFYEAPNRTAETLKDMAVALGPARQAAVGRELTKKYEEFVRGSLEELAVHFSTTEPRGEITIVIAGAAASEDAALADIPEELSLENALAKAIADGLSERDAVKKISAERKLSKRDVYAVMLEWKKV